MSNNPWFSFYPSDWLNGTAGLSLEEVGAYIQIVALLYENENALALERIEHPVTGKLQGYSYRVLARRLNSRSDRVKRIVERLVKLGKLSVQAGFLTSHRVGKEIAKREKKSKRTREAAHKRWQVDAENVLKINVRSMR